MSTKCAVAFTYTSVLLGILGCLTARAAEAGTPSVPPGTLWTTCVPDFDAEGDAETNDMAVFQAALDAAAEKDGIVYAPAGAYRIDGALDVPQRRVLIWRE